MRALVVPTLRCRRWQRNAASSGTAAIVTLFTSQGCQSVARPFQLSQGAPRNICSPRDENRYSQQVDLDFWLDSRVDIDHRRLPAKGNFAEVQLLEEYRESSSGHAQLQP
jgi:hypothetical protein